MAQASAPTMPFPDGDVLRRPETRFCQMVAGGKLRGTAGKSILRKKESQGCSRDTGRIFRKRAMIVLPDNDIQCGGWKLQNQMNDAQAWPAGVLIPC